MAKKSTEAGLKSFQYTAVSQTGERVKAKMQAPDQDAVSAALIGEGWVPIKITELSSGGLSLDVGEMLGRGGFKMKPAELAAFARQLHQLLRAGVAVPRTLAALGDEADPRLTQICLEISDAVSAGTPLSSAFEEYPDLFNEVFCSYIAAGEEAGTLVQSTGRLAVLLEKEAALRNKIKSATAYPKMASMAIGGLVIGIMLFLVPSFQGIYRQFNAELPMPTQLLMEVAFYLNPVHPQFGSVTYVDVPLKKNNGEMTPVPILEGEYLYLNWSDIEGAWDPLTAPTSKRTTQQLESAGELPGQEDASNEDVAPRELDNPGKLLVDGNDLVAETSFVDQRTKLSTIQGVSVMTICKDGTIASPSPPGAKPRRAGTDCEQDNIPGQPIPDISHSESLVSRYKIVLSNPSLSWLNPFTWLQPLSQPSRPIWTSPINFLSPALYLILAIFLVRRFLKRHQDDLDIGEKVDRLRFGMPIFGGLNKRIAMFRWTSTLSGALEAGVQTYRALDIAGRASGSRWVQKATLDLQEGVRSGRPISTGLAEHKDLFAPTIRALVTTGEQTGDLDTLLDSASQTLDEEINAIISGLAARIEVVLIISMGVVVGTIVIILYLPIFNLALAATDGLGAGSYTPPGQVPPWVPTGPGG